MHHAINTTKEAAYAQMQEKQEYYIRHLVRNRHKAEKVLKKMSNRIKRDKNGRIAKKSIEDYQRMERFRAELNTERLMLKKCK